MKIYFIAFIYLISATAFGNEVNPKKICEVGALKSSDEQVRSYSSNYCQNATTVEIATCMAGALQSSDERVRGYAFNYCQNATTVKIATCMAGALQSSDERVRSYAFNYCQD
jgi:hypothetical protein